MTTSSLAARPDTSSRSVVRALRILELLAHADGPQTLAAISAALAIPKSTAHTILRDLAGEGFVEAVEPAVYVVGIKAFEVGSAHLRRTGAVEAVGPELARLTRDLGITAHYAVLDGMDAVYLRKEDPPGLGVRLASSIGARLPSHLTAVGKACLAWLDGPDAVAAHVRLGTRGLRSGEVTLAELTAELRRVRERGYAVDDEESAAGIRCVAAPVFDTSGPKGAVGVSYLLAAPHDSQQVAALVVGAADRASASLGGRHRR